MSPDRRPNIQGIFVSGATGTPYSTRTLHNAMRDAYGEKAVLVSYPPRDSQLANLLRENSGHEVDLYVQSSGGAQFRRALRKAGEVDTRNMTVVAIDIPTGLHKLSEGMKIENGIVTRAIDSITAF